VFLQGSTSITYGSVNDFVDGDRTSRAFAVIYSVSSLAGIAGPIFFGLIGDHLGLAATMSAMAVVSLLAAMLVVMLRQLPVRKGVG
jgi:predicted MFS family arabinose efflux permease